MGGERNPVSKLIYLLYDRNMLYRMYACIYLCMYVCMYLINTYSQKLYANLELGIIFLICTQSMNRI